MKMVLRKGKEQMNNDLNYLVYLCTKCNLIDKVNVIFFSSAANSRSNRLLDLSVQK